MGPFRPPPRRAAELEIEHHLRERADALVAEGWDPDEAMAEARRRFGDSDAVARELARTTQSIQGRETMRTWIESLAADVRSAARALAGRTAYSWTFVVTLAVGIGATTAVFVAVDAALLRPLPFHEPDRLATLGLKLEGRDFTVTTLPIEQARTVAEAGGPFQATGMVASIAKVRAEPGRDAEELRISAVTHDFDELLGVRAQSGRALSPEDALPGATRSIVLTDSYWRQTGADPGVVGTTVHLDGDPFTVVGVLEPHVDYPVSVRKAGWIPLATDGTAGGAEVPRVAFLGRLRDGLDPEAAAEVLASLSARLTEEVPARLGWDLVPTYLSTRGASDDTRRGLWLLAGAAVLILLVATANGAALLLLRADVRGAELAVRRAIGASRGRIFRHVFVEGVALALSAALASVAVAAGLVALITGLLPQAIEFTTLYAPTLDRRAALFTFAVAGAVGGVLATCAGVRAVRAGSGEAGGLVELRRFRRSSRVLATVVVAELGLSVVLVSGATLFLRSFADLLRIDPGFDVDRTAMVELVLSSHRYDGPAERWQAAERLRAAIAAVPQVEGVALASGVPPDGATVMFADGLRGEGREPLSSQALVPLLVTRPEFGDVLGVELVGGRWFTSTDDPEGVVLIDRDLARLVFGEDAPVGRRIQFSESSGWREVVGVLAELPVSGVGPDALDFALVVPMPAGEGPEWTAFALRTSGDPLDALPAVRRAIREVDPAQPLRTLHTGRAAMSLAVAAPRFITTLLSLLAGLALALSALGVYGVVSYAMTRRRRELGIRAALGASAGELRALLLRQGVRLAAGGALVGGLLSMALARGADTVFFGMNPGSALGMAAGALVLVAAAVAATWIPAVRASRVDPVRVLQSD